MAKNTKTRFTRWQHFKMLIGVPIVICAICIGWINTQVERMADAVVDWAMK